MGTILYKRFFLITVICMCWMLPIGGCTGGGDGGGGGGGGGDGAPAASETRIYGQVFDASDDSPLAGVQITVTGVTGRVTVDAQGRFVFPVPTSGTYDITATLAGYTYAQRRVTVADRQLAAARDMYLTALDSAVITIGSGGGTGANSDDSIRLEVPSGALRTNTEMRATWFNRGRDLPNTLPNLSHFTYACELTPDGQTFGSPVTVRMENTRGFAPGTPIPVGVYNSTTLAWEPESMGVISDDGQWVVFEVSHFSPRDCNLGRTSPGGSGGPGDADNETASTRTTRNNQRCGSVSSGSRVDVQDGHLLVDHLLPTYRSIDQQQTIALQYNSQGTRPAAILELSYDLSRTRALVPEQIRFIAEIGGNRVQRTYEPIEGPMTFTYYWNGRDPMGTAQAPGTYNYTMTLINDYQATFATADGFGQPGTGDTGVLADEYVSFSSTFGGSVIVSGQEQLALQQESWNGRGWTMVELYELRQVNGSVMLLGGGGDAYTFISDGAGGYTPADGDFSQLTRAADGTFTWTLTDGRTIRFDTNGLETSVSDRNGNSTTFAYTAGRLATVTDPMARATTLSYDDNGMLNSITDPVGRTTQFQINSSGNLVQITNPDSTTRTFAYDANGRMTSQTDAGGQTTTYTYDTNGAVTRVDRADSSHTLHAAAMTGSASYTDPNGEQYTFMVNSFGTRTAITDPLGRTIGMARDENDAMTTLQMPSGKSTTYDYDDSGNLVTVSGPIERWDIADSLSITYGPTLNLPLTITDDTVGSIDNTYDANGNLVQQVLPDGRVYTFGYNTRGQRTSGTLDGRTTSYTYDTNGNLATVTDPGTGVWTYSYDTSGNIAGMTDPDGRTWSATYNSMNLIQQVTDGQGDTVGFTYAPAKGSLDFDGVGPVAVITGITDGRTNTTIFGYDSLYRLTTITDALTNITRFGYDNTGRITSTVQPSGARVDYTYNSAGQLIQKDLGGTNTVAYTYDNDTGLPLRMTTTNCRLDFTFDWYDHLEQLTTTFLPSDFSASLDYQYRASNSQESMITLSVGTNSSDFIYAFDFDHGWLPIDHTGSSSFWFDLTYDSDSSRLTQRSESYSSVVADFLYDAVGRTTQARYSDGGTFTNTWTYSSAGYITTMTDPDGAHTYTYDDAGRLTQATHPTADNPTENYTYDAASNRLVTGLVADFVYDAANRLTADSNCDYVYDQAGNLIQKTVRATAQTTTYTYDAENHLTSVALPGGITVTFRYDPLDRLCEKQIGANITRYLYDRDQVIAEFDGSGNLLKRYINGEQIDILIGVEVGTFAAATPYFYYIDPVGTVLALADADANVVVPYRYNAFGQPVHRGLAVSNDRMFAGRDYDSNSELYYVRNRFYDPATGRFLQRDPDMLQFARAPYIYAANNPINLTDPFGLHPEQPSLTGWKFGEAMATNTRNDFIGNAAGRLPAPLSTPASAAWQLRDLISIARSDNPGQAAVDWFQSQYWNFAADYMPDFLTMGGIFSGRFTAPNYGPQPPEPQPVCSRSGPPDLRSVMLNLRSSRALRR